MRNARSNISLPPSLLIFSSRAAIATVHVVVANKFGNVRSRVVTVVHVVATAAAAITHVHAIVGIAYHSTIPHHVVIVDHARVIAHQGFTHKAVVANHHLPHHGSRAVH